MILIVTGSTDSVVALANVAAIAAMAVINIAVFIAMRRTQRDNHPKDGVHLPGGPVLPTLGLITALSQLFFIHLVPVLIGAVLLAGGSVLYLVRHRLHQPRHHARLEQEVARGDTPGVRAIGGRGRVISSGGA